LIFSKINHDYISIFNSAFSSVVQFLGLTQANPALNSGSLTYSLVSPGILQINFIASDSITLISEDVLMMLNFIGLSTGITELD